MRKILIVLLSLGAILFITTGIHFKLFLDTEINTRGKTVVFSIKPGSSIRRVALSLQKLSLIDQADYLVLLAKILNQDQRIRAGEYEITPGTTPIKLLNQFVSGKVIQHSLTLIEGWTFKQMMQSVQQSKYLVHTLGNKTPAQVMTAIGHEGVHWEGRFFPDTYSFPRDTSDADFLQRAYAVMTRRLDNEWANRSKGLPLKGPYETLILASIVERETAAVEERPLIANVFLSRLKKRMLLQTDPTVIYGMGDRFKGDIRYRDLREDTPYNTYVHRGLPPTPIAMPSGEAIHAVLHPEATSYLYFVAKGEGKHQFSRTLKEHNAAVRKYQLKQ
ncbi:MAG: endolytic transglycosylase MltG [Gammaproteobacteria bacterium]|nr:endolytic transglycosylase MltG [Gammaproteobacteria bacterium]